LGAIFEQNLMPIIQSAKKQMRVSRKKQQRNYRMRDKLKDSLKDVIAAVKGGKKPEAEKAMQAAYKAIDTASKKNIIHKNNANRKKAGVAKMVANIDKVAAAAPAKKKGAKKAAPKKAAKKVEEPKAEAKEEKKEEEKAE
jgi:small subunit ribosomal protein S20